MSDYLGVDESTFINDLAYWYVAEKKAEDQFAYYDGAVIKFHLGNIRQMNGRYGVWLHPDHIDNFDTEQLNESEKEVFALEEDLGNHPLIKFIDVKFGQEVEEDEKTDKDAYMSFSNYEILTESELYANLIEKHFKSLS